MPTLNSPLFSREKKFGFGVMDEAVSKITLLLLFGLIVVLILSAYVALTTIKPSKKFQRYVTSPENKFSFTAHDESLSCAFVSGSRNDLTILVNE